MDACPRSAMIPAPGRPMLDRKSTRLNSSHSQISYAVFCLKKKKNKSVDRFHLDGKLGDREDGVCQSLQRAYIEDLVLREGVLVVDLRFGSPLLTHRGEAHA